MGIRCDQHMGLTAVAQELLNQFNVNVHVREIKTYPDGREVTEEYDIAESTLASEEYDSYTGMFDQQYPLLRYFDSETGEVLFEEFVQAEIWSAGPMFYLALRDGMARPLDESLWQKEDMET